MICEQFVKHRLGLATIKLSTKFEVSTFTYYQDMRGDEDVETGLVWGLLFHKVISSIAIRCSTITFYSTLVDRPIMHLFCTVSELFIV